MTEEGSNKQLISGNIKSKTRCYVDLICLGPVSFILFIFALIFSLFEYLFKILHNLTLTAVTAAINRLNVAVVVLKVHKGAALSSSSSDEYISHLFKGTKR